MRRRSLFLVVRGILKRIILEVWVGLVEMNVALLMSFAYYSSLKGHSYLLESPLFNGG